MQRAIDAGEIALWEWHIQTGDITWSANASAVLRAPPELLGTTYTTLAALIEPEDHPLFDALAHRSPEQEAAYQLTFRVRHPDNTMVWFISRGAVELDAQGTVVRAFGVFWDVSEQQRREAGQRFLVDASRILASSLEYETTLHNLTRLAVPVLADWCSADILDEDGHFYGIGGSHVDPEREPLVAELQRRYPPDPKGPQPVSSVFRSGQSILIPIVDDALLVSSSRDADHVTLRRRLGFASVMVVPLIARERVLGAMTYVSEHPSRRYDHLDLQIAENLARHAALAVDNAWLYRKAQQAIEARNDFLRAVAHELNTPLTSLRGFAQLLARQVHSGTDAIPSRARLAVDTVNRQALRLQQLVAQLLDVGRLDTGTLVLHRFVGNLTEIVEEAVQAAQAATTRHRIHVIAPASLEVDADHMRIGTLLSQILDTAMKSNPEGGDIEVTLEPTRNGGWELSVADPGSLLAPADLEHIFDRFHDAPGLPSATGNLGVGLYAGRRIVQLHGGTLVADARAGGGMRFRLTVPAPEVDAPEHTVP